MTSHQGCWPTCDVRTVAQSNCHQLSGNKPPAIINTCYYFHLGNIMCYAKWQEQLVSNYWHHKKKQTHSKLPLIISFLVCAHLEARGRGMKWSPGQLSPLLVMSRHFQFLDQTVLMQPVSKERLASLWKATSVIPSTHVSVYGNAVVCSISQLLFCYFCTAVK